MKNLDVDALQGIMDFLLKSMKPKKKEDKLEEAMSEMPEEMASAEDELEELPEEYEEDELAEDVDVRPLPGENRKPKGLSMSITQLGLLSKKKGDQEQAQKQKKKGKK